LLPVDILLADLDHRRVPQACVLDGIADQIGENLLEQSLIAFDKRQGPDFPFNSPVMNFGLEVLQNQANDESLWPRNDGSIRAVVTLSCVRVSG